MHNIIISYITIKGFRSFRDDTKFFFNNSGLHAFTGKNGAGKTSIIEALYWVLTGDNLKGDKQDNLINKDSDECIVSILLHVDEDEFIVTRSIGRRSLLNVIKNGEDITALHIKDTQNLIHDFLNVSSDSLLNTVIFGQRMRRLIESSNDDKRRLFEELFEMGFIDAAKNIAQTKMNELSNEVNLCKISIDANLRSRENVVNSIQQITRAIELEVATKAAEIERLTNQLNEWQNKLTNVQIPESLPVPVKPKESKDDVFKKLNAEKNYQDKTAVSIKLTGRRDDLRFLFSKISGKEFKSGVCNACGQEINVQLLQEQKAEELANLSRQLDEIEIELKQADVDVEEAKKILDNINHEVNVLDSALMEYREAEFLYEKREQEIKNIKDEVARISTFVLQLHDNIEAVKNRPGIEDNRPQLNDELNRLDAETYNLNDLLESNTNKLNQYEWWYKKGFGPNGLKAYVFKYMLDLLNDRLKIYTERLGISVVFTVDISGTNKRFETVCRMHDGTIRNYSSLSGGEKARVDISIAFAMYDLLKSTKATFNVLFLDEVFENLDDLGVEECFDLLRMISESCAVYLISHKEIDSLYITKYNITKNGRSSEIESFASMVI